MAKVLDAIFIDANGNKKNFLYQYDKGQTLVLEGLDYNITPEVHFTTSAFDEALIAPCTFSNGTLRAPVPDALLMDSRTINVYIYLHNSAVGETVETMDIFVLPRKKPTDYIYTDSMYILGIGGLSKAINNYLDTRVEFVEDIVVDYTTVTLTDNVTNIKYTVGINDGKLYIKEVN